MLQVIVEKFLFCKPSQYIVFFSLFDCCCVLCCFSVINDNNNNNRRGYMLVNLPCGTVYRVSRTVFCLKHWVIHTVFLTFRLFIIYNI